MGEDQATSPSATVSAEVLELFKESIPDKVKTKLPVAKASSEDKVTRANEESQDKLIAAYTQVVKQQLKLQRPLSAWIIALFGIQPLILNGIIVFLIVVCMKSETLMPLLFEFLRYYIGAVVVELLGLVAIIIKSTFSSSLPKIVEKMFSSNRKDRE